MDEAAKKWIVVYPLYLDKARSVSDGRRVPAALAVEKPQAEEIAQVLKYGVCDTRLVRLLTRCAGFSSWSTS